MRDPDSVGLWTQALQLLEENLGDDATKPSWKQFKESSHSIGLKTIESSLKSAEVSIQKDHPEHSISKLRWNTGSILRHLRVVFQVGDEAMKYAPETACIVWSTFSMVFKCISAEVDLCDTIMSTSERVTHWIFVGELYAKHYQPNSTGNDERAYAGCAPESQERILKNIVQIFSVVLRFCYELKQLDLSDDTPEVLEPEAKPSRWSGKRLIDRGERMVKKMGRGLKAFFGKTEDVRGFLKDGDDALRALETTSGIDWKTMATEVLNKISDNITDIKMDTQGLRKDLETVMTNIKELREQNSAQIMDVRADVTSIKERVENSSQYVEMRKWLQETTGLEREQPIQQYEEIQETMREQHCVWIHDDPSYCQWIKGNDGVCWLSGKAETGKSSMTAYVIGQLLAKPKDELQFTDDPGLNALKHDCAGILKAMKDDLRAQGPDKANLKSRGRHSVDPRGQGSTTSLDVTWQYALKAAFVKILSVFHRAFPRRKVFMLLDALDTCKQGGMESLCDILNSIAMDGEASGDIKVWITSRSPPLGKFREALKIDLSKRSSEHISDYIVTELRAQEACELFILSSIKSDPISPKRGGQE
ncbi:Protein serac1 [Lasiodiplodia theobromae]|uniref:Protein serac1 n=1 Tax=Lasiodiplodia theobromae TaxID=45133 RepID=UPI0015C31FFC|nr:Protein serac1 [Lasiodiplodia theobromae]KAF4540724.1 Protein serac1 [Lasiodiplodia theobromae]